MYMCRVNITFGLLSVHVCVCVCVYIVLLCVYMYKCLCLYMCVSIVADPEVLEVGFRRDI